MDITELVKSVKRKLGISSEDTKQDQLIEEEINDLMIEVLEYCGLKELPKPLTPFIKRQVVSYILSGMTGIKGPGIISKSKRLAEEIRVLLCLV